VNTSTATLPVFELRYVPGAADPVEWTAICHRRENFVAIGHDSYRSTSRWKHVERTRKFSVAVYTRGRFGLCHFVVGWYATIEAARVAARKTAADQHYIAL
jgi:hypothetical protein